MGNRQEPRDQNVALKVTASEARAVRSVADLKGVSQSELLRTLRLEEIVEEYRRIRAAVGTEAA